MTAIKLGLALAAVLALTGCAGQKIKAPSGKGICWYMADQPDGTIRNNKVAEKIPNIEQCAAELERMRIRFLRMGGTNQEIVGAYQGIFIMLKRDGIYTANKLNGMRYMLLMRVNGKLVVPGAVVEAVPAGATQVPVDGSPK